MRRCVDHTRSTSWSWRARLPTEGGAGKLEALATLDLERDNLQAAMRWAVAARSELALPLAATLWRYWLIRGERRQGLSWLEQALDLPGQDPSPTRSVALAGAALLARLLGDVAVAERRAREGVTLGRSVGPPRALIVSLNVLVTLAARAGDLDRARARCEEAVAVARAAGDERLEALALFMLAEGLLHAGRYAEVGGTGDRALALARSAGDDEVVSLVLARLGIAAVHEDRLQDASAHLIEALEHARRLGFPETARGAARASRWWPPSSGDPDARGVPPRCCGDPATYGRGCRPACRGRRP